jgi:hypothetical protein
MGSTLLVFATLLFMAPLAIIQAAAPAAVNVQPVRRTPSPRPTLPAPAATATRPVSRLTALPSAPALPTRTPPQPGQMPTRPGVLVTGTPFIPAGLPVGLPSLTPAVTVSAVTRGAEYAAADAIRAFAQQHLGLIVVVGQATGATGAVTVPATVQDEIDAAAALAGQVSVGVITAGNARGAAEVAVGSGSISGDLEADISAASLGAYSLVVATPDPRSNSAALDLIRSTYPGLIDIELTQTTGSGAGYVFAATTMTEGVDPKTRTVTAVLQQVMAGVIGQGRATVVWAVVANGDLAAALSLP